MAELSDDDEKWAQWEADMLNPEAAWQRKVAPFEYLWRVDDKSWLKARQEQWRYLAKNNFPKAAASEKKELKDYFVYGRLRAYMTDLTLYLLIPLDSPETARQVFWSKLFGPTERGDLLSFFLGSGSSYGAGMPWLPDHMRYFVSGVLGHRHEPIMVKHGRDLRDIAPAPGDFCDGFIASVWCVLEGRIPYSGYVEAIDYFLSALPKAEGPFWFSLELMQECYEDMWQGVERTLADSDAPQPRRELAEALKAREAEIRAAWEGNPHLRAESGEP